MSQVDVQHARMISLQTLTLESLQDLDNGIFAAGVNRCLQKIAQDCHMRPGEKNPRKLAIELKVKPEMNAAGQCVGVQLGYSFAHKLPVEKREGISCGIDSRGIQFRGASPDAWDQPQLPMSIDGDGGPDDEQ